MARSALVRPQERIAWYSRKGNQPLFLQWLTSEKLNDQRAHALAALIFVASVASVIAPTSLEDRVLTGVSRRVMLNDLTVVLLFWPSQVADPTVSFLRDIPSLMQLAMIAALFPLVRSTLLAVDEIVPSMTQGNTLRYRRGEAPAIEQHVRKLSSMLSRRVDNVVAVVLAVSLAILASRGYYNVGVFQRYQYEKWSLADATVPWARQAYELWWARAWGPGFIAWIVLASVGCYLVLAHVRIVTLFSWFVWKHRKSLVLSVSPLNFDGGYGWQAAKRIIAVSSWAMVWYAVGIWAFTILTTAAAAPYLSVFAVIFLNGLLLLGRPLILYSRTVRNYKISKRQEFANRMRDINRQQASSPRQLLGVEAKRAKLRDEVLDVSRIPDHLFGGWRLVAQIVLVVIPAVVAIATALYVLLG